MLTLFSFSQTYRDQLDPLLPYHDTDKWMRARLETRTPTAVTQCTVFQTSQDFTHYIGFTPAIDGGPNKDAVRLMMLYQCDNEAIDDSGETPSSSSSVSEDMCRTGVGVYGLNTMCQDVLFVWTPGSEGEAFDFGYGITANPVFLKIEKGFTYLLYSIYFRLSIIIDI